MYRVLSEGFFFFNFLLKMGVRDKGAHGQPMSFLSQGHGIQQENEELFLHRWLFLV